MSNKIAMHMDTLIAAGVEFQIGLRGAAQPLGPAKVEKAELHGLYRMLVPATMQANKNSKPSTVVMPVVFDGDDVLIVIEAPQNLAGESAIITPNGGRTPGGLHIPGGS